MLNSVTRIFYFVKEKEKKRWKGFSGFLGECWKIKIYLKAFVVKDIEC